MDILETRSDEIVTLAINGKLDGISAPALETKISGLVSAGVRRIIFDCSGLDYISSAGLRVFLGAAKRLQTVGGRCGFAALSPEVQKIFQLCSFNELLEIHETVADARA